MAQGWQQEEGRGPGRKDPKGELIELKGLHVRSQKKAQVT